MYSFSKPASSLSRRRRMADCLSPTTTARSIPARGVRGHREGIGSHRCLPRSNEENPSSSSSGGRKRQGQGTKGRWQGRQEGRRRQLRPVDSTWSHLAALLEKVGLTQCMPPRTSGFSEDGVPRVAALSREGNTNISSLLNSTFENCLGERGICPETIFVCVSMLGNVCKAIPLYRLRKLGTYCMYDRL